MAHFARIDENNVVVEVLKVSDDVENNGNEYLNGIGLKGRWIQTSFNTFANKHTNGGEPLRKNFASVGDWYIESLDAFASPKPFDSWILNEDTCQWETPLPYPEDGKEYLWNEETTSWTPAE